jgi:hypothetical protein
LGIPQTEQGLPGTVTTTEPVMSTNKLGGMKSYTTPNNTKQKIKDGLMLGWV